MRCFRGGVLVCLLIQFLFLPMSLATDLVSAEIANRDKMLQQTFALIRYAVPHAQADGRVYNWLDTIHLGRTSYDLAMSHLLEVISEPYPPHEIIYRKTDATQECPRMVRAYVDTRDRAVVHLCTPAFIRGIKGLAQTIIHEFAHVRGIQNECDADAFSYLTFVSGNIPALQPSYFERCYYIRDLMDDMNKEITSKMIGQEFLVSQESVSTLMKSDSVALGNCILNRADPKFSMKPARFSKLTLSAIRLTKHKKILGYFKDGAGGELILECYSEKMGTIDLFQLGLMPTKKAKNP